MRRLLAALAAALLTTLAAAATPGDPPASVAPAIAKARTALDGAALTEAQRANAVKALDAAAQLDEAAESLVGQIAQVRSEATPTAAAPAAPSAADRQRQLQQWIGRLPASADVTALERLLASEHAIVSDTRHAIDEASQQLTTLISRPATAPAAVAALRQRAEAPAPAAADDEPAALTQARLLQHGADQRQALADLALREAQQATAQARQVRLEQQLLTLRQQLDEHLPRISWLEQRIATEGLASLTAQADDLAAQAAALPAGNERVVAQANADLAAELLTQSTELNTERQALTEQERTRELMTNALRDTEARLRVGGRGTAIGQWLWQQRLATPSLSSLRLQRKGMQERLGQLRLALFNNTKARDLLAQGQQVQPTSPTPKVLGESELAPPDAGSMPSPAASPDSDALRALRATQVELYNQLDPLLRRRIDVLERADAALQTIADAGGQLQSLMTRQLLWTPSHLPMDSAWFSRWAPSAQTGLDDARAWRLIERNLQAQWGIWAFVAVVVVLALLLRWRGIRRLRELAQAVADPARDRFRLTLAALGWSLLIAVPASLAVSAVGMLVHELSVGQHGGLEALGQALQQFGDLLYYLSLTLVLLRPYGLADSHLRWPPERLRVLYQGWRAVRWLAVPSAFTVLLALQSENAAAIDTWARTAVIVYGLGMAAVTFWMASHLLPPRTPGQPRTLARRAPLLLLPAAFASTALMAATGYLYSGILVLDALQKCLAVLLAVAVVDGLLRRWLLLGEQRLAQRNRAQAPPADTGVADGAVAEDDGALTLVAISAQSRRLLRLLRIVLVLLGLLWAGADVLPALARFEDIRLWSSDGTAVTLMNVLAALLLLALVASLARNLPGLMELALTPYPQITAATRYTTTTLARYAIVIAGVLVAFGTLGLRWGQLQWMAAALTVGLGFGLQEIFANFVSGLILLVERPFRVGDTITIGDLTGTVTRIHTRATTVLDYDNKEIVIPNKTFITGQVTNWTLSDDITRLTLNVGVGYGSPPERVRELLLQIAREHPLVLPEPPPNCWFMDLGASTLDFELRLYVGQLGDRLLTRHQMLTRITEVFAAEGIEIAFPQMDVHVRDWPTRAAADRPGA